MNKIEFCTHIQPNADKYDTLVLPVFETLEDNTLAAEMGANKLIEQLIAQGDFSAKLGKSLLIIHPSGINGQRLILIGLGKSDTLSQKQYLSACQSLATQLENCGTKQVLNGLAQAFPANQTLEWAQYQNTLILQKSFYDYAHPSRGDHPAKKTKLSKVIYLGQTAHPLIAQAQATALGMALTQDLANLPSNYCTPSHLAKTASQLSEEYGFELNVLERDTMIKMGMGAFMAVAQGATEAPKLIGLSYQGADANQAPIALVGKGVTFDTGGISLKPGEAMDEMKYDMGGAATVLGIFKALGELKPKINVVGVIPATENMPSAHAIKPGDVVKSLSGQTIEILNTDAEGRLLLCDALTYTQQTYHPSKIIDMATLTGACIIALGHHISAVMGNQQSLVDALKAAGEFTYDRFWQLPLSEEYDEQLKSNFADMANIGGRPGGSITAAQFLARFTKEVAWAHCDIAGTAWQSGANKGATGRPVPALVQYLLSQV